MTRRSEATLGSLIKAAREKSGLTLDALAAHAGISRSSLISVEKGREVSILTVRSILMVQELDIPPEVRSAYAPDTSSLNAWLAPGFSPLDFFRAMRSVLRGAGGLVEQSYLYYDHAGAADWAAIASQEQYQEAHRVVPLDRAAAAISKMCGRGADIIALGPGDGRLETRFVGHLADLLPQPALRFYLLDISQPLLAEAYRHASSALGRHSGISPVAILGDFHALPQYTQLSYSASSAPRKKVIALLGGTMGNLEDERRFVRESLCGFAAGTLLLLDYPVCFAPADQPDQVRSRDPWLSRGTAWRDRAAQFWSGPLRRYVPGCTGVDVRMDLAPASAATVPGSYTVEALARVSSDGHPDREFSIFRMRRYSPIPLASALRELGWDPLDGWAYGQDVGYPRALALFSKR